MILLPLAAAAALAWTPLSAEVSPVNFFENSTRRDPTFEESRPLVEVFANLMSCAGFLVENAKGEPVIATARHCAAYRFEDACRRGLVSVRLETGGARGVCRRVVVEGTSDDMVVFLAEFPSTLSRPREIALRDAAFLRLAESPPPSGARLQVLGYPDDPERARRATVSENCWVNDGPSASTLLTDDERASLAAFFERAAERFRARGFDLEEFLRRFEEVNRTSEVLASNCSIYAGNSGGPILIPGRRAAYGMTGSSVPEVTRPFPSTASNTFYSMSGFVRRHRAELERAGVAIGD
ncbi:MAG: hypothetical protein HY078_01980 [Elusimicrobia bacterium]|nr:hypothetical protein [Elusimicrobiota bacterium]